VKAIVGPYQLVQSRVAMVKSATSPFWNEDLMFVAAEPFDELLHLLIEERVGNKVSGGDFATFLHALVLLKVTCSSCSNVHKFNQFSLSCNIIVPKVWHI
jgi:hypothetical protein